MTFKMYLIRIVIMPLVMGNTLECLQRNISCEDIKTAYGFNFSLGGPEGSEIYVSDNGTVIGHARLDNQSFNKHPSEVKSMDNHWITTRDCRDLHVQHIVSCGFLHGKPCVNESCLDYKVTEENMENPSDSPTPWAHHLIICGVIVLPGIVGLLCYKKWKKQLGAAAAPLFSVLRYLRTSSCHGEGAFQAETGAARETRHHEESQVQQVTANDLETQHYRVIRLPANPDGSGEHNNEEDDTLGSVHVHSIDPEANGETSQSLSLDRNLSDKGIQPPKNGDTSTPDANGALNHRAMHRNLRDDPGGVNDKKGKDIVRIKEMLNGRTPGGGGPEDHENEGLSLLTNQRAAPQCSDMTGEAVALVYNRGFDPDQVSWCSAAPDTDVESTQHEERLCLNTDL